MGIIDFENLSVGFDARKVCPAGNQTHFLSARERKLSRLDFTVFNVGRINFQNRGFALYVADWIHPLMQKGKEAQRDDDRSNGERAHKKRQACAS